jgi:hypothetical protein
MFSQPSHLVLPKSSSIRFFQEFSETGTWPRLSSDVESELRTEPQRTGSRWSSSGSEPVQTTEHNVRFRRTRPTLRIPRLTSTSPLVYSFQNSSKTLNCISLVGKPTKCASTSHSPKNWYRVRDTSPHFLFWWLICFQWSISATQLVPRREDKEDLSRDLLKVRPLTLRPSCSY